MERPPENKEKVYTIGDIIDFFQKEIAGIEELVMLQHDRYGALLKRRLIIRGVLEDITGHENFESAINYFNNEIDNLELVSSKTEVGLKRLSRFRAMRQSLFN